ncbi:MAG: helix-turn-helix transcriptional regulator [Acidimicrobiales bacterium]
MTGETRDAPVADDGDLILDVSVASSPLVVFSQTFPARPSSFPEIRDFVRLSLVDAPISDESSREVQEAVADALLQAAGPKDASLQVSFRIYLDHVEVDVLRSATDADVELKITEPPNEPSFAQWMAAVIKRKGLSQEAAARQLGVSVRTVSRWVLGETEPRLRELRRIRDVFGEVPIS